MKKGINVRSKSLHTNSNEIIFYYIYIKNKILNFEIKISIAIIFIKTCGHKITWGVKKCTVKNL